MQHESTLPPNEPSGMTDPVHESLAPSEEPRPGGGVYGLAVWGAVSAITVIYLLAFPIRIQYWVRKAIDGNLWIVEDRKWMPVRDVWWRFIADAPIFGTQWITRVLIVLSMAVVVIGTGWILRLVLLQEDASVDA